MVYIVMVYIVMAHANRLVPLVRRHDAHADAASDVDAECGADGRAQLGAKPAPDSAADRQPHQAPIARTDGKADAPTDAGLGIRELHCQHYGHYGKPDRGTDSSTDHRAHLVSGACVTRAHRSSHTNTDICAISRTHIHTFICADTCTNNSCANIHANPISNTGADDAGADSAAHSSTDSCADDW